MNRNTRPFIPFARPSIGDKEIEAARRVLESGWLTTGGEAAAFEKEFANIVGARRALAVSSATAGLHVAVDAAKIGPTDRVILSPYTFTASAEVLRYREAHPLFVDITEGSLCFDEERVLDAACDPQVRAIMPVHVGGTRWCSEAFVSEARRRGITVIEDAAHLGPSVGLPAPESRGDYVVYSFYATKPITTGEGGMVVTDCDSAAHRIETMRLHGIDRPVWDRQEGRARGWEYDVVAPGYKYNLPDLAAAIGRVQLKRAASFRERRARIADIYFDKLADRDYLHLPKRAEDHSWHLFVISIVPPRLAMSRDELAESLAAAGIGTSVHYKPLHLMSYYRDFYGLGVDDFPVSSKRYMTSLSLPIYPDLSDEDAAHVAQSVRDICDARVRR